jgi:threonine/homoserine/homoserine lactone efflux protein
MRPEQTLAFLGFSIVVAGTPGPSNALLTATGANVGVVRGLPALVGVAVGMGALLFVTVFGLGTIMFEHPIVLMAVKWSGAVVLCWLAWKIATSHGPGIASNARPVGLLGAAGFQWINPKSWLVCTSAAATFVDQSGAAVLLHAATLALLFVVAALPSCFAWLAFGAVLQRALRSQQALRTFNIVMGVLLAASVVLFIT